MRFLSVVKVIYIASKYGDEIETGLIDKAFFIGGKSATFGRNRFQFSIPCYN